MRLCRGGALRLAYACAKTSFLIGLCRPGRRAYSLARSLAPFCVPREKAIATNRADDRSVGRATCIEKRSRRCMRHCCVARSAMQVVAHENLHKRHAVLARCASSARAAPRGSFSGNSIFYRPIPLECARAISADLCKWANGLVHIRVSQMYTCVCIRPYGGKTVRSTGESSGARAPVCGGLTAVLSRALSRRGNAQDIAGYRRCRVSE